jgi:MFS family permease
MPNSTRSTALPKFVLLYALMYAAFGVASPFLPAFVSARGLSPEQLGLALGAGTAVRLLTAPLAGRIGDLIKGLRLVLTVCTALAASATLAYLPAHGFGTLVLVMLWHAASLAPTPCSPMPWRSAPPLRQQAAGAEASNMAGYAVPGLPHSSSALCGLGRCSADRVSTRWCGCKPLCWARRPWPRSGCQNWLMAVPSMPYVPR